MRSVWCVVGVGLGVQAAQLCTWFLLLLAVPFALDILDIFRSRHEPV